MHTKTKGLNSKRKGKKETSEEQGPFSFLAAEEVWSSYQPEEYICRLEVVAGAEFSSVD